jgi:hypothetical protein
MSESLRFPVYVLRAFGSPNLWLKDQDENQQLAVFTSAEQANLFRSCEALDVQVVRLKTPHELRELLAWQRAKAWEFKVVLNPESAVAGLGWPSD